ncbi:polysaccharide biosynthesis/export family protein [Chryseobacterium sp. A301]
MKYAYLLLFALLILSSCKTFEGRNANKDENALHYMKNIEEVALQESKSNTQSHLQVGDEVQIIISALDVDVAKPFNQNYSSGQTIRDGSTPAGNQIATKNPIAVPTYRVEADGQIDFPVLGKVNANGLTVDQLGESLRSQIKQYIKEPSVNIKLSNYRVSVLGEVRSPGKFLVPEARATLLEALGMAGDLTVYGKRDDVLVIRNEGGQVSQARIDLTDANFINSPYYNLVQGDVVYVLPNKTQERISKRDPNNSIYISIASILVTIIALVVRK